MRHIHPFPARMAPEIALGSLNELPTSSVVLDPMSGSGMVLSQASRLNLSSIGVDLDPLARLIARVGCTKISLEDVRIAAEQLRTLAESEPHNLDDLDWMDDETKKFVQFWFDVPQAHELSSLAYHLEKNSLSLSESILDLLRLSVSRLIVTKEPKASRARDTAHSRPHRTIETNNFSVLNSISNSVDYVCKTLKPGAILNNGRVIAGDARNLCDLENESIDRIVTSPPYLNAIDYMRGHKLSLIWFGYSIPKLREIRGSSIGAERSGSKNLDLFGQLFSSDEKDQLGTRRVAMILRYIDDLTLHVSEAARVLKCQRDGIYVIGDSTLAGVLIRNSEILKKAAALADLRVVDQRQREIPESRRYLPFGNGASDSLRKRMRFEHIIRFTKCA